MAPEPAAPSEQALADDPLAAESPAGGDGDALEQSGSSLAAGGEVIAQAARNLPNGPGVYRMLNRRGDVLYVGKAQSLRKRVASYAQPAKLPRRQVRLDRGTLAVGLRQEMDMDFIGAEPCRRVTQVCEVQAVGVRHRLPDVERTAGAVGIATNQNVVHLRHQGAINERKHGVQVPLTRRAAPIMERLRNLRLATHERRLVGRYRHFAGPCCEHLVCHHIHGAGSRFPLLEMGSLIAFSSGNMAHTLQMRT